MFGIRVRLHAKGWTDSFYYPTGRYAWSVEDKGVRQSALQFKSVSEAMQFFPLVREAWVGRKPEIQLCRLPSWRVVQFFRQEADS